MCSGVMWLGTSSIIKTGAFNCVGIATHPPHCANHRAEVGFRVEAADLLFSQFS